MGLLTEIVAEHEAAGTEPEHSPIGASASHRYIHCPGSVAASRGIEEEVSPEAAEGTSAHALGEKCLRSGVEPWEFFGEVIEGTEVDQEMVEAVTVYTNYCRQLFDATYDKAPEIHIEAPVRAKSVHALLYGTVDFGVVSPAIVTVVDFKYGAGIAVDAVGNSQGRIYARGLIDDLGIKPRHIQVVIVQPRAYHPDGPIREEWITYDELVAWEDKVLRPALVRVDAEDPDFASGDWCRFCPARAQCLTLLDDVTGAFPDDLNAIEEAKEHPDAFSVEVLGGALSVGTRLQILVKALKNEAYKRMMKGAEVPGQKLVKNKADRVWKEGAEEAADILFGDKAYAPQKLKSPAQMAKMLGGDEFVSGWAYKPDAGLTIAPEGDKREAVSRRARDIFKSVNQDGDTNV